MKNINKLNFSVNHPATQRLTLCNSSWIDIISEDWMLRACENHVISVFSLHIRTLVVDCMTNNCPLL